MESFSSKHCIVAAKERELTFQRLDLRHEDLRASKFKSTRHECQDPGGTGGHVKDVA